VADVELELADALSLCSVVGAWEGPAAEEAAELISNGMGYEWTA